MKVISPISNQYLTKGKEYDVIETIEVEDVLIAAVILDDYSESCKIILVEECPHLNNQSFHWIIKESHHDYPTQARSPCHQENRPSA